MASARSPELTDPDKIVTKPTNSPTQDYPDHNGLRIPRTYSDVTTSSDASAVSSPSASEEESEGEDSAAAWPQRKAGDMKRRFSVSAWVVRKVVAHKMFMDNFLGNASSNLHSDDSDGEELEKDEQGKWTGPPAQPKPDQSKNGRFLAPHWPPAVFSLLEPVEREQKQQRRTRSKPEARSKSRAGRGSSRRNRTLQKFVDQDRAAAHTTDFDIKTTLELGWAGGTALVADTSHWRTMTSQAEVAQKKGRHKYAVLLYTNALHKVPPKHGQVRIRLGRAECLIELKKYDLAKGDASWALKEEPTGLRARWLLADALLASGELEEALVSYHQGRHRMPGEQRFLDGVRRCEAALMRLVVPLQDYVTIKQYLRKVREVV